MVHSQLQCLCLLVVVVTCYAEGVGSQLRGSAAAVPEAAGAPGTVLLSQVQHTDCGCSQGSCKCQASPGAPAGPEQVLQGLMVHTQALEAWWRELGESSQQMQCVCSGDASACHCERAAGNQSSVANASESVLDGRANSTTNFDDELRNETTHLMSLWWVAHGGGCGYGYHHGWYGGGYRHIGYTGCGCAFYGCHCGHVGYGGFR